MIKNWKTHKRIIEIQAREKVQSIQKKQENFQNLQDPVPEISEC